ncbi:MAG: transporter substrate-binding domain-containing protein [Oscillospiraceae bacterium]|nr:transporter substrate-binding domain-containing protein [Oscillospiraceae bacterium]
MKTLRLLILIGILAALPLVFSPACCAEELPPEMQELDGKRFGVQTGSTFDRDVLTWFPHAEIVYYNSLPDLAVALETGKIDAFPSDGIALEMMRQEGMELTILEPAMDEYSCGVVFAKTPEGGKLRDQMDAWMDAAREKGLMDEMLDKWLHAAEEDKTMPDPQDLSAENGVLVFATEAGFPPFDYMRSGEVVGFEVEMAILFCREFGYGIEIIPMNFDGILPAIQSGKVDFSASGFAITPERMESINFSQPYYTGGTRIVVRSTESGGEASFFERILESIEKNFIREDRWKLFVKGIENTLIITGFSVLFGTMLGFGIFMLCRKGNPVANTVTNVALRLVQGMPMVVLLMILYYVIFGHVSVSGIVISIVGFTLTFGSGIYGLLKIGVDAVDRGQYEAAYSLGHTERGTFFRFILPQALPHILPACKGEIVSLLKATAIVGYIAVQDLTKMSDIVRSRTYEPFFPLIAVALIYFVLEDLFSILISFLERKLDPKRRTEAEILKGVK